MSLSMEGQKTMIFQHTVEAVLNGTKTQTRRVVKENQDLWFDDGNYVVYENGRVKYRVGQTYAVQPGRCKKAVARIRITDIRQEHLHDITAEDAVAEGIALDLEHFVNKDPVRAAKIVAIITFSNLWQSIHTKPGRRWEDNPMVWVISFELEGQSEEQ